MSRAKGSNRNTFRRGLNTDMHPLDTSKEVMTDNANAVLITSEGDEYILQNMRGNELKTTLTPGYEPIAIKVFNNVAYILSRQIQNPTKGEIGTFPSPDWEELNKQIPIIKDLMIEDSPSTTQSVETPNPFPISLSTTISASKQFTGYWPVLGIQGGCNACGMQMLFDNGFILNGGPSPNVSNLLPYNKTFSDSGVYGSSSIYNIDISSIKQFYPSISSVPPCDCNGTTVPTTYTGQLINPQENFQSAVIGQFGTIQQYQVLNVTVDFTGTQIVGTLEALTGNGIINASTVNGTAIDAFAGTVVEFRIGYFGTTPPFFRVLSNDIQSCPQFFPQSNVTALGPPIISAEFTKYYDITSLGLSGLQLSSATFSLYHSNPYPIPGIVDGNIQYRIESTPSVVSPTVNTPLFLPPGAEEPLIISGVNGANTMNLIITYPGTGFAGQADNYELYITYESDDGEIVVDMIDEYKPLYNFFDYNGIYTELPPPSDPPTEAQLDEEGYYVAPFRTESFDFSDISFVDIELQPSYDRSINIIYTDNKSKPNLINSRFIVQPGGKTATLANRQGVRDTNIYSNERWGNTDLILTSETIAKIDYKGLEDGGNLLPGGYKIYFVYANSDLQTTAVFGESGLIQVTKGSGESVSGGDPDERLGKTIYFQLSNLDTKFLYVKVFVARDMGQFNAGTYELREIFNLYPIGTGGVASIRITGFELTLEKDADFLDGQFTDLSTAQTLTAVQGSLAVANIETRIEYVDYLRAICANIQITEDVASMADLDPNNANKEWWQKRTPYSDPNNVYYNLGYWNGETYELGLVFKMSDSNLLSPVIPLRGIDNFDGTASYVGSGVIPAPGFDESTIYRENTNGVYRTQEGKVYIDGDSANPDSPNITYLKINVSALTNDPFIKEITDGFFVVRKTRSKDCQYEGYLTQAAAYPLAQNIPGASAIGTNLRGSSLGSMENIVGGIPGDFVCASNPDTKRYDVPAKYVPMMASLTNAAFPASNSTTAKPTYTTYFGLAGNPHKDTPGPPGANDVWSHFAFYTPDIVTRPTDVASFFSGTSRGLRYASNNIYINSANNSAWGGGESLTPSLFHSTFNQILTKDGRLTSESMTNYTLNNLRWNYITAAQDTVTAESFTGILQGIQFDRDSNTTYGWRNLTSSEGVNPTSLGQINFKYDDYVGLVVNNGDSSILKDLMQTTGVDGVMVSGTTAPSYGFTQDTFYDNLLQNNSINMGVLTRVYATEQGPLTMGTQWQAKYQSTTSTGYFAVTDRYDWETAATFPGGVLDIFSGDCYIGDCYKRLNYKLGIPADPAATDPNIYGNQAAQLADAGITVAMFNCSSTNFTIRSEEFKSASEQVVYGIDRQFYPLYSISDIRVKKQLDSKLYYAGFNLEAAAVTEARQVIELPTIVDSFPYRILLSAPADLTSFTNGYRDFSGLNFRDYDSAFGQIIKLVSLQSILFVIWEHGVGRIYTREKTMVTDEDGGVFVDQASRLQPQAQVIANKYGTTDPYSIQVTSDAIYGIDWTHNKVWQLNAAGQFNLISDFNVERVLERIQDVFRDNTAVPYLHTGYDSYRRNVFFNYGGINNNDHLPVGSLYYNEILKVWVSKLSFYPYFIFNIRENWYSFNFAAPSRIQASQIWQHESETVPFCHFYGSQQGFEYEYILVDNPALQKILTNLKIISTNEYPQTATYTVTVKEDYETGALREESFVDPLVRRYRKVRVPMLAASAGSPYIKFDQDPSILPGEFIIINEGTRYEVQDVLLYLDQYYVYLQYSDPITGNLINSVSQAYPADTLVVVNNGIIRENILYKEDHFYIVVGSKLFLFTEGGELGIIPEVEELPVGRQTESGSFGGVTPTAGGNSGSTALVPGTPDRIVGQVQLSAVRDKYIRVKLRYKGDRQVFVQAVESLFTYSFS